MASRLLPPKLGFAISGALQELSTNAAKYAAFSIPSGQIAGLLK
jgi:two-component sensor histidine kinase